MARYIPDHKTQRWVVISPGRTKRPEDSLHNKDALTIKTCPFCYSSEANTPPEVYRIGSGEINKPGWDVRVVPNKFPITDIHEVIIHSPDHSKDIESLPLEHVAKILKAYKVRYQVHEGEGQVIIFCNHGLGAGASLAHPHSQLVVIPRQINLDALTLEPISNVVFETDKFITYCPEFSQWPYEVWIAPKSSGFKYSEVPDDDLPELASVLQKTLQKIEKILKSPDCSFKQANEPFVYNFYISHTAHWFIRIAPRAIHRAGFELGTGLCVNIIDPQSAARQLSEVIL